MKQSENVAVIPTRLRVRKSYLEIIYKYIYIYILYIYKPYMDISYLNVYSI
jgi:hypothetical protein